MVFSKVDEFVESLLKLHLSLDGCGQFSLSQSQTYGLVQTVRPVANTLKRKRKYTVNKG